MTTSDNPSQAIRRLTIFGVAIALVILGLGVVVNLEARKDAWQQADKSTANLTLALERDIRRNISTYDLSLQGAMEAFQLPGIQQMSPEFQHAALFDRASSAQDLGSLLILDADGNIIADSTAIKPHNLNLADRDYFQVQREQPNIGLYVSRPFESRLRGGSPSIAISRRLPSADGRFAGVVVGTMQLTYFQKLFVDLDLSSSGAATLFRSDGEIIVRYPSKGTPLRGLAGTASFHTISSKSSGHFVGTSAWDGVERSYAFRRIGDFPLILSVGLSTADIRATWWHKALFTTLIQLTLCGATIALCLLFRREMMRRVAAEQALTTAAAQLSTIAATDSLTGLGNRRAFEVTFEKEWRRSVRSKTDLALLMLDADWFKLYNDRYGHPEGDEALKAIAGCIQRNIRRPADVAARYGGEEFVILLPETDTLGALVIAGRIRNAVAALALTHEGSPIGHLSVSIGVAVAEAFSSQERDSLVKAADKALYEAKREGRNRVYSDSAQVSLPDSSDAEGFFSETASKT